MMMMMMIKMVIMMMIAGEIVVSGSVDKSMKIWTVDTSVCQRTLEEHEDVITVIKIHVRHH